MKLFKKKVEKQDNLIISCIVATHDELKSAFMFGLNKYVHEKGLPNVLGVNNKDGNGGFYTPGKDKALDAAIDMFFQEIYAMNKKGK